MYNKLFTKILDSSIWLAPDPHRLVWVTFLAVMDEDGNAFFACADNLAARARVTVEQAEAAIKTFESPDPKSGDPENEGRRIERFPGGWHVLNAHKYRSIVTKAVQRQKTRERVANWRAEKKDVTQCNNLLRNGNASVTPSEAVSISVSDTKNTTAQKSAPIEFEDLKRSYPKRSGDQGWQKALKACSARVKEGVLWNEMIDGAMRYKRYCDVTGKTGTEFVKQACTFFGPDKHYLNLWVPPPNKAEQIRNTNVDASLEWLAQQEKQDAVV